MAGFIFSIANSDGVAGVAACIRDGLFSARVPSDLDSSKARQVVASVLCDYLSMCPGDNVYFLSKRKIYGVGKLKAVDESDNCILKNYPSASQLTTFAIIPEGEIPLAEDDPTYRWLCFFEPEGQFFKTGVDMDDVLGYRPQSFRMLRAFQDRSFIKIDDEENRALKEYLYLANQTTTETFEFNAAEHRRITAINVAPYAVSAQETIAQMHDEAGEVALEMLVEAAVIEELQKTTGILGEWDYVSHQVIASPFKPISYIDKIDVFAYRLLQRYPGEVKPIERYLIIELKKGIANHDTVLQAMRYVDWVCKEYAAGDYSRIEAKIVAHSYRRNVNRNREEDCTRHFITTTHPIVSEKWDNLKLYRYELAEDASINFVEQ